MVTYTLEEVSKHNKNNDLWIIYKKQVFDVTKFLENHPGGEEVLLDVAGRDATSDFEDVGHSDEAKNLMKDFYIGDLSNEVNSSTIETKKVNTIPEKKNNLPSSSSSNNSSFNSILTIAILGLAIATLSFFVLRS